jgi:proteasome lid subunit RPN8/RPN11
MKSRTFHLSQEQANQIMDHLEKCLPEEGCGLIGGKNDTAEIVFLAENILHSPMAFLLKPEDQLFSFLHLEKIGLDLIGLFHSHPDGPNYPSSKDINEFLYPGVITIIFSKGSGQWKARAYEIFENKYVRVELEFD